MRTMLLSFKPEVYDKIKSGIKIFEHRRSFPDEPIKAYMYVSSPVCAITGIVYLNNRHNISDWLNQYQNDSEAVERITKYLCNYRYAMEISEFQETSQIPLSQLRHDLEKFVAPQMYYYIDNSELLEYINSKLTPKAIHILHSFEDIQSNQVCQN